MGIFDFLGMTLSEILDTDRALFAEFVGDEVRDEYLSYGKVLSLDYYRYFGRPFTVYSAEQGEAWALEALRGQGATV